MSYAFLFFRRVDDPKSDAKKCAEKCAEKWYTTFYSKCFGQDRKSRKPSNPSSFVLHLWTSLAHDIQYTHTRA